MSMPLFLIGFAMGQIIGGPVSDNSGRKPIGIAGFSLFTVASVAILFTPTVEALWALRFIQAFGGGFGAVAATISSRPGANRWPDVQLRRTGRTSSRLMS